MKKIVLEGIAPDPADPFSATTEELLAAALKEAGLITSGTTINGRAVIECLESWNLKNSRSRELSRIGNLLLRHGMLSEEELRRALRLQDEKQGLLLGEALVELGICTPGQVDKVLGAQGRIREDMRDLLKFREKIDAIKKRLRNHF